jgi:glycosyltransferase involved in cell wall biosynthesis
MKNKFTEDTYIPKNNRKTILLLSDDLRMSSGVGTVSREIVINTAPHFNWIQVAAAISHPDKGKIFDLGQDINTYLGIPDASAILYPNDGYGDPDLLRLLMSRHKIDAILHYTDPRFWIWLYQTEHELRQRVPILFYHVWDDLPYPKYNASYYESCDWISCISRQSLNIVHNVWKKNPPQPWQTCYIPHGINEDIIFPIVPEVHVNEFKRMQELKQQLFLNNGVDPEFIILYNNRNIRRKLATNVILAYNKFVQELPEEKRKKCVLLMHTAPVDENGTDLPAVVEELSPNSKVIFSPNRVTPLDMNCLYNLSDVVFSMSNAEGFGLGTAEGLMSGKMIIATVTGGLQDQMRFEDENGKWIEFNTEFGSNHTGKYKKCGEWAIPLFPDVRSLTGSPLTPYIYEDYVAWEKGAESLHTIYNMSKEERQRRGLKGREWMLSEESGMSASHMAQRFINGIDTTFQNWKPRKRFTLFNA